MLITEDPDLHNYEGLKFADDYDVVLSNGYCSRPIEEHLQDSAKRWQAISNIKITSKTTEYGSWLSDIHISLMPFSYSKLNTVYYPCIPISLMPLSQKINVWMRMRYDQIERKLRKEAQEAIALKEDYLRKIETAKNYFGDKYESYN